jgi:predicted RNA-binding Zn-ribbon protein involved in translation (DUF1610 family)
MAIALSCPSCDHELKVKDELAGRKIKCPKCGAVIAVRAAAETRVTAAKARGARHEEDDDEFEEEERPKKKRKKKKAKSNLGLIIGSAAGVLALVLIVVLVLVLPGSGKDKVAQKKVDLPKEEPPVVVENPPQQIQIQKKDPAGGILRSRERTEIENTLRQLGIAYRNFEIERNRGPKDQKEFEGYYERNQRINEYLTNQWVIFIWGAGRNSFPDGASNTILAYESIADRQENRFVLMGDGSVQTLDEATFQKTPKAKGK